MIEIKPTPVIRLLVVIALAVLCLSSVWFQIESKGTYVEGIDREPTLWANYSIDGEVEVMELEISNATPLMLYWFERDNINNIFLATGSHWRNDGIGRSNRHGITGLSSVNVLTPTDIIIQQDSLKESIVIYDDDLTGKQTGILEELMGVKILDRSTLILDIFANRAQTAQAKKQVELAEVTIV